MSKAKFSSGLVIALLLAACSSSETSDNPADPGDAGGVNVDGSIPPPGSCGRNSTPCPAGAACEGAQDCASGSCPDGTCHDVSPPNGTKDGDETDIDCGGKNAPACADGKGCLVAADCTSGVCTGGICQAPSPTDKVKNGDETDVDCGGANAPKCASGKGCKVDGDCDKVKCDPATNKCAAATNTDGIQNGDETGVDCGGTAPNKCPTGQGCNTDADCDNVKCDTGNTKKCLAPSSSDGLKNGTESDVDCGGGAPTNAPRCVTGKTCAAHADCASDGCDYNGKCALAPSCAPHEGGDTCGKREIGQNGAAHESCCASTALTTQVRIDKYEITAGRMREFIKRTGGNVRAWVDAHRAQTQAQIPDSMLPYLPESNTAPVRTIKQCQPNGSNCVDTNVGFGVYSHLGNTVFMPDRPCGGGAQGCGQGCYVNTTNGAYGHPTYWWDATTQVNQWQASARDFDQATLDVKSLNCVAQLLLAAFCAWDGGRLPTNAELGGSSGGIWGPGAYPWSGRSAATFKDTWSNADPMRKNYFFYDNNGNPTGPIDANAWFVGMIDLNNAGVVQDAPDRNTTNWNPFGWSVPELRYAFPARPFATWDRADQAFAIAAPGRMVQDSRIVGPGATDGWYDVAGNLMEVAGDYIATTDDANHNSWPRVRWMGGSFEGHNANNKSGYDLSILTKYGKQGGRCARPNN